MRAKVGWIVAITIFLASVCGNLWRLRDRYWMYSTDLALYVHAGEAIANGKHPYDAALYTDGRDPVWYGAALSKGDPYAYSPWPAELVTVLLLGGRKAFRVVWWLVSFGSFAGTMVLLMRGFGRVSPWPAVLIATGVLAAGRVVNNDLYHGQMNLPLLFLLILSLQRLTQGRRVAATLALALACACKPFLGVILLYLAWRREWRVSLSASLGALAILLVSFVPLLSHGLAPFHGWMDVSRYYSSPPFATRPDNQSLYGLFLRLFTAENNPFTFAWLDQPALVRVSLVLVGLPLLWLFWRAVPQDRLEAASPRARAMFLMESGLVFALALSLGPLTQGDYVLFLLPGLAGLWLFLGEGAPLGSHERTFWMVTLALWSFVFLEAFIPVELRWGLESGQTWTKQGGPGLVLTGRIGLSFLVAGIAMGLSLVAHRSSARLQERGAT